MENHDIIISLYVVEAGTGRTTLEKQAPRRQTVILVPEPNGLGVSSEKVLVISPLSLIDIDGHHQQRGIIT